MKNIWTIAELDTTKLFEVIYNRNPEISTRFGLPIPKWLDELGNPRFDHPKIKRDNDSVFRFHFYNYKDDRVQKVKISGDGVIMFGRPTPGQAAALRNIIFDHVADLNSLAPEDVENILARAYNELVLIDRYNDNRKNLLSKMDNIDAGEGDPAFGRFVYKTSVVSTCIHLLGIGEFGEGLEGEPQKFGNDAFLVFPEQRIEEVKKLIQSRGSAKGRAKIVEKVVFLESRTTLDGRPINTENIPAQDTPKKRFYKPRRISGFREWTPEIRDIERNWIRAIEEVFERFGFVNIETPAVEEIAVLTSKGEVDKEIYSLGRLQDDQDPTTPQETPKDPKIALHYDLTVPLARYVAQHFSGLTFPFKRYQIQKVWRGESPQRGRFREFVQCDIDVVDRDELSLEFDAEIPMILYSLVEKLDIGKVIIGVNNRKILQGFYQGLGLENDQIVQVIRAVDKLDKIGDEGVRKALSEDINLAEEAIEKCIVLAAIKEEGASVTDRVLALDVDTPLLREGLEELDFVMDRLHGLPKGAIVADMSIARGLDYYTGTVYEGRFADNKGFPAILAGGRYDNLVNSFMDRSLPGVGISFGLTRVFAELLDRKLIVPGRKTPSQVLVTVPAGAEGRNVARRIVDDLRNRGIRSEVYHEPAILSKQLQYAHRKGISHVVLPDLDNPNQSQVRDMNTGIQERVLSIRDWAPGG